jgi:hypothetical protein
MNKALVAGALGVTGRALVNHLVGLSGWEVIGVSRRSPEFQTTARYISVDLLNRPEVETRLRMIGDVTHVFFAALQPAADFFAEVAPIWPCLLTPLKRWSKFPNTSAKWCCSRAPSFTAHISVPIRHLLERLIRGTRHRIFITTKRIT